MHQQAYNIFFQVWRPSPAVENNGCYSLVGENRFTSINLDDDGLVSETPEPSNIISVQPEDVVGYYTFSRKDLDHDKMEGIQLDHSNNIDSVWYHSGNDDDTLISGASNCPFPVGTQIDRILTSFTNAAPVLSVSLCKFNILVCIFTCMAVHIICILKSLRCAMQHCREICKCCKMYHSSSYNIYNTV